MFYRGNDVNYKRNCLEILIVDAEKNLTIRLDNQLITEFDRCGLPIKVFQFLKMSLYSPHGKFRTCFIQITVSTVEETIVM